jgi:hypothetical protein
MVGGGVGVLFGSYGTRELVIVTVGSTDVLVKVSVIVGGIGVAEITANGGGNVGGGALVAVFSGVGGIISVGVGGADTDVAKLQLNNERARVITPNNWLVFLFIFASALLN